MRVTIPVTFEVESNDETIELTTANASEIAGLVVEGLGFIDGGGGSWGPSETVWHNGYYHTVRVFVADDDDD